MPIKDSDKPHIGMVLFAPKKPRDLYCKRFLHSDELPYFVPGNRKVMLDFGSSKVAPAICYESLLPEHADWRSFLFKGSE